MYYELYIDVLFCVNMVMDFFLLSLTKRLLGCHPPFWRVCLGSAAGAAAVCLIIWLRLPDTIWRSLLLYAGVNSLMIMIGLGVRSFADFARSFVCLYMGGFLLGGAYQWLSVNIRNFLMLSTGSYIVLTLALYIYKHFQVRKQRIYKVILYFGGQTREIQALKDTGNSLRDPLSGRPVSVIEAGALRGLLSEEEQQLLRSMSHFQTAVAAETVAESGMKVRFIPFRSVGKQDGLMPAILLEKMCIDGAQGYQIDKPVVAVCQEPLASDECYQMILHPELVEDHTFMSSADSARGI